MKKLLIIAPIIFCLSIKSTGQALPQAGQKDRKTVLIVPDCQTSGINLSTAQACSSYARTLFLKDGRFSVVERKYLLSILMEHRLQMTGLTDASVQKKLGKILAADKFFVVYVNRIGDISMVDAEENYLVKLEFIDVETGEIEIGEDKTVQGVQAILRTLESLGTKLANELPVKARILSLEKNLIYLNKGSKNGLHNGKTYKIIAETKQIKDQSGKVVFRKKEVIGKGTVTSLNKDSSEMSVNLNTNFPLKEGAVLDLVIDSNTK